VNQWPRLPRDRIKTIHLPQDRLRSKWWQKHPYTHKIGLIPNYVGQEQFWQHPCTHFINRQWALMKKGFTEREASDKVEEEDRKSREYRISEWMIAVEQMEQAGVRAADLDTAEDLLRKEESEGESEEIPTENRRLVPVLQAVRDAREEYLKKLLEYRKSQGRKGFLKPEELPRTMNAQDVTDFVDSHPQYAHFFDMKTLRAYLDRRHEESIRLAKKIWFLGEKVKHKKEKKASMDSDTESAESDEKEAKLDPWEEGQKSPRSRQVIKEGRAWERLMYLLADRPPLPPQQGKETRE